MRRTVRGACLALAAACAAPPAGPSARVVARIHPGLSVRPLLDTPREVTAGDAFTITVTTLGSSCTEPDGGTVEVVGGLVRVVSYDRVRRHERDGACHEQTPQLASRPFSVTLTKPGAAVIRVVGVSATAPDASALDSLDAEVAVRP